MSKVRSLLQALREVRAHGDRISTVERELIRLGPQLAALEQRVEDLRVRLDDPAFGADQAQQAEARSLVDEVRAEHAKVRARISAAVVFEERLRVLEAQAGIDPSTGRPAS
jgi:predicted nuclease with TOPRIM domain